MDSNIKVTVILPVYNGALYLRAAIESVLHQSYPNLELLIIDDGSTDTSIAIAKSYTDPRVRIIVHEKNLGLIATLNEGLQLAQGHYIARIDCDDIWINTQKLERQITFLENNSQYAIIGTQADAIDALDKKIFSIIYPETDTKIRSIILSKNCFVHSSVVFRRDVALQCLGFLPEEKHAEDYGLWLRIGEKASFANLPEVMVAYRINTHGVTQRNNHIQIQTCLAVIAKHKKNYPHYFLGILKWDTKLFLTRIFGTTTIEAVKSTLKY